MIIPVLTMYPLSPRTTPLSMMSALSAGRYRFAKVEMNCSATRTAIAWRYGRTKVRSRRISSLFEPFRCRLLPLALFDIASFRRKDHLRGPAEHRDQESSEHRGAEAVDVEMGTERRGDTQQSCVDHEQEEPERQDDERQAQNSKYRSEHRVDDGEDERDPEQ